MNMIHYTYIKLWLPDRDNFINVIWNNVDPQRYDFFAVSDSSKFSRQSIHYNPNIID